MNASAFAVTSLYAAVLGLLAALLTVRVIVNRVKTGVQAGDGGNAELAQAIRAHANLAEQGPFAIILIGLAEAGGLSVLALHGLGLVLLAGRFANAWGLSRSLGPTKPRQLGAGLTLLVVVAASIAILVRSFAR